MAKASCIPTEIWLLIASYLPKSQVLQLKSLNSSFFYCAMDINWRKVVIHTRNSDRAARLLSRMANPFVVSRIRELVLTIHHLRQPRTPPNSLQATDTLVTQLLDVLPLLHNLTYLEIEVLYIALDLLPALFHTITTSPLARTIATLSLSGHPSLFASLVECPNPETTFANLSELNISQTDFHDYKMNDLPRPTIPSLARFILSFSASLQLLRIWSLFDISLLLSLLSEPLHDSSSLIPFPNLKSISLIFLSERSSPQSIHRFLLVHSTKIQHVRLGLRVTSFPGWEDADGQLGTWLSDFVNDDANGPNNNPTTKSSFFPNLRTLDIQPPATPTGLSATLTFIKRTLPTLSSLIIRDCELTRDGADQVVHVLAEGGIEASKLKSLRMDIYDLNAPFIRLLALKLPQLQKLRLRVTNYHSKFATDLFVLLIHKQWRVESDEDDNLGSWKLRYLSIWHHGFKLDDAEAAVASNVPSIVLGEDDEDSDG